MVQDHTASLHGSASLPEGGLLRGGDRRWGGRSRGRRASGLGSSGLYMEPSDCRGRAKAPGYRPQRLSKPWWLPADKMLPARLAIPLLRPVTPIWNSDPSSWQGLSEVRWRPPHPPPALRAKAPICSCDSAKPTEVFQTQRAPHTSILCFCCSYS